MRLKGMPQMKRPVHLVPVPPADPGRRHNFFFREIGHNTLHGPLCDADPVRHVSNPYIGVLRKTKQDVSVVAQKSP